MGTLGIPHGQQSAARALVAGTFLVIDKPTPDEEFEEELIDDVSGAVPVLSGNLPVAVEMEPPVSGR